MGGFYTISVIIAIKNEQGVLKYNMNIINQIKPLIPIGRGVLNAVLPARCPVSGDIVEKPGLLSPKIWGRLNFIERPFCARCGIRFDIPVDHDDEICPVCVVEPPSYDSARAVFAYDDVSRAMILAFKHGDQTHLTTSFIPWMIRAAAECRDDIDLVIPVPLHRFRMLARRYNQAGLLAKGIARAFQKPFVPGALVRVKRTISQGYMTAAQRAENIAGAFRVVDPRALAGKSVLLVDDVYTTGATVIACTKALKRAGAQAVHVVTIGRVMRSVELE